MIIFIEIGIYACLWPQDGGISNDYELRMQDHWMTEILSNYLREEREKEVKTE